MKSKRAIVLIVVLAVIILGMFMFSFDISPSGKTRVIVDHTYHIYIAPECFDQAETTNHLTESTLAEVKETDLTVESPCTEQLYKSEKKTLIAILIEKLGIRS